MQIQIDEEQVIKTTYIHYLTYFSLKSEHTQTFGDSKRFAKNSELFLDVLLLLIESKFFTDMKVTAFVQIRFILFENTTTTTTDTNKKSRTKLEALYKVKKANCDEST